MAKKSNSNDIRVEVLRELARLYREPPGKDSFIIWCKKMAIQYDMLAMTFSEDKS